MKWGHKTVKHNELFSYVRKELYLRGTVTKRSAFTLLQSRVIRRSKCWMTTEVGLRRLLFLVFMTSEAPRCFYTYRLTCTVVQGHHCCSHYWKKSKQRLTTSYIRIYAFFALPTEIINRLLLSGIFFTVIWRRSHKFYGVNVCLLPTSKATFGIYFAELEGRLPGFFLMQ